MKGDALIKGGHVIDGMGAPAFAADLRIKGGKIVEIGPDLAACGEEVFDANGCYVSPGFIDTHAHYDGSLYWDPKFDPIAQHGVTTLLIGNCGLGIAPIHKHQIPGISALFSYIEDLPRGVFDTEIPWTWGDFNAYVSDLRSREYAVNVTTLVSHSLLRMFEVGDESWSRPSTPEERKRLANCLDRAMKAGALGFSTSRFDVNPDGNKVPSYFADAQEWDELFAVAAKNKGVVQIIPDLSSLDNQEKDLREMCELSTRYGGVPVMSNGIYERPEDAKYASRLLDLGREMRAKGADFYYFASPRSIELVVNFHQCMVMMYMPAWADLVQSVVSDEEKKRRLADPVWRATAREQWNAVQEGFPSRGGLARCRIITVDQPEYEKYLGKTFDVILAERGGHPSDVLADWALENNLKAELVCPFTNLDLDVVGQLLAADVSLISGSDAGAHIGMFDGAGDTTLVLTRHVRDRHDMSLEVAIKRMSNDQAKVLGLVDRGTLEVGKIADIAVFNLDDLNWAPEKKVFDVPGGGSRLRRPAGGFRYTFVSGILVQKDGEYTGAMPARFLGQEARVASLSPVAA